MTAPLTDVLEEYHDHTGKSLFELSQEAPLLVVFLRHMG